MDKKFIIVAILLCILALSFIIYGNKNTSFKGEIDKKSLNESRLDSQENEFVLKNKNINYNDITKYYAASNSYLMTDYDSDLENLRIELTFKADNTFFLYNSSNSLAYQGNYKLVDNYIYAKVEKIYKDECYIKDNDTYIFNIISKNGRKVIDLMIDNIELKEIDKKLLTITNEKYNNKDNMKECK